MREYRAFNKKKNEMIEDVTPVCKDFCIIFINGFKMVQFYDGDLIYSESVGIEDVDKDLIFGGDICLLPTGDKKIIIHKDGAYGYEALGDFIPLCNYKDRDEIKIIGNIYENPELLKQKKGIDEK